MRYISFFFTLLLAIASAPASARPISYPGGWTVMTMNDGDENTLHLLRTMSARYSVGIMHQYMRDAGANMDAAQVNFLMKRWNSTASQGNLYLMAGAGAAYDGDESNPAVMGGLSADWEDRRYYVSYENMFLHAGSIESHAMHKARAGIAPYIAGTGRLHTWLMLQADYRPEADHPFTVTPLVRFFKGPVLTEAGYNLRDNTALFNLTIQF